jgi:hypothetical protein
MGPREDLDPLEVLQKVGAEEIRDAHQAVACDVVIDRLPAGFEDEIERPGSRVEEADVGVRCFSSLKFFTQQPPTLPVRYMSSLYEAKNFLPVLARKALLGE